MEKLDQKCSACRGTGRQESGDANLDSLEHAVAQLKWEIAEVTEEYGLDLRHRATIPGEAEARERVGKLQMELAGKLSQLEAVRRAGGDQETICQACQGRGLLLTDAGQQLINFIYRWIHPRR